VNGLFSLLFLSLPLNDRVKQILELEKVVVLEEKRKNNKALWVG
jgi:hypothetical protein